MAARTTGQVLPEQHLSFACTKAGARALRSAGWLTAAVAVAAAVLLQAPPFASTALFCLAIVQLTMNGIRLADEAEVGAARLVSAGSLAYAAGVLLVSIPSAVWLIPMGMLSVLLGLGLACRNPAGSWNGLERRILVAVMFTGVALDGAMVLATLAPLSAWASYLGPADALRFRLLALARVAAMTLPSLALLHQQASRRRVLEAPSTCWSCLGLHAGAVLMPSLLLLAAVVDVTWKYLLPIPALMIFAGACSAAGQTRRLRSRLELGGWVLVAGSMGIGLLMGMYAFDGPLPAPAFIGAYGDVVRSFVRQAHGFAIVVGILLVFLARQKAAHPPGGLS